MPELTLELSGQFLTSAADCPLSVTQHARKQIDMLLTFPDMGKRAESTTITSRFGDDVRTLVCGSYLLVYQHEASSLTVLALYPARLIR